MVALVYFGGTVNDGKFDDLVFRLPKDYLFLKLEEEDFDLVKSLLEEEQYQKGKLLIARNREHDIDKKYFENLEDFEEIVRHLETLQKNSTQLESDQIKSTEL